MLMIIIYLNVNMITIKKSQSQSAVKKILATTIYGSYFGVSVTLSDVLGLC